MSLVNLTTNILVPSYTHVHVLPMAIDQLPEINVAGVIERRANSHFSLRIISGPDYVSEALGVRNHNFSLRDPDPGTPVVAEGQKLESSPLHQFL